MSQKTLMALVMPAYNEQDCIEQVAGEWANQLKTLFDDSFVVVVVNDGSKDQTGPVLDRMAQSQKWLRIVHQKNAGHGEALRRAYAEAVRLEPEYVFHVDSDNQFLPSDFEKLWSQRSRSQFILGYRQVRHDARHRLVITQILRGLIWLIFGRWIPDSNIPYRLIRARFLTGLLNELPPHVFAPNVFLSVLATSAGQDPINLPVEHRDRQTGAVSIVRWRLLRACLLSAWELIKFRFRLGDSARKLRQLAEELSKEKSL